MIDDRLADDIVRTFEREPKRWKEASDKSDPYTSWYVRDDQLRVGVGFTGRKHAIVKRGDLTSYLSHGRSIDRVWRAAHAWREWLRVETLTTIAKQIED